MRVGQKPTPRSKGAIEKARKSDEHGDAGSLLIAMDPDGRGVKLLLIYDPIAERREDYFHFTLGEFVPVLEHLGLTMCEVWHTAYGDYPLRLIGFLAPDRITLEEVLASDDFLRLESKLLQFVVNYKRRIVPLSSRFQF